MPNALKAGTLRVSYVEDEITNRALGILAAAQGVTISALVREATNDFLKKRDPENSLRKVASDLRQAGSDTAEERAKDGIDPETAKAVGKLLKKFGK